jgi:hypothetical protein
MVVPDRFDVVAMIAIGKSGPKENLQERGLPNSLKPLGDMVLSAVLQENGIHTWVWSSLLCFLIL